MDDPSKIGESGPEEQSKSAVSVSVAGRAEVTPAENAKRVAGTTNRVARVGTGTAKQTGAAVGKRAVDRATNARMVADTIERTHPAQVAKAASRSGFVKDRAGAIKKAAEKAAQEGTRAGGREQIKGHFIEALDVKTYNDKGRWVGKKLVPRKGPKNKAYDASRVVNKKFAGAVQQKSSAAGTEKAIAQMEKVKRGSATRRTLRVPSDHVANTQARAAGRIRVKGMEFTTEQAGSRLDKGLGDVAKRGSRAGSTARATAKGATVGAAVTVVLGAVGDAGALHRGDIDGRDFAENRALDAAEGATNAVVGVAAAGVGGAAATAALGTSAGIAAAASAGAAGTAVVGAISGMGTAGAAVGGVLGGVTVAAAAPAVIGGAAVLGSGVLVGKGYKRARTQLRLRQERRRLLPAGTELRELSAAELDSIGQPIVDAVVVEDEILVLTPERRGRAEFSDEEIARSAGC
jgi:hypothetical protein